MQKDVRWGAPWPHLATRANRAHLREALHGTPLRARSLTVSSLVLALVTSVLTVATAATGLTAGSAHAAKKPSQPPPRIVFQRADIYSGDYRIMLGRPNGQARYLTGAGASSTIPVWSPHGTRIAYARYSLHSSDGSAATDLVIMGARGRNKQVVLPGRGTNFITDIAWAPGGRRLALLMWRDTGGPTATATDIYILDLATRQLQTAAPGQAGQLTSTVDWSPDGTTLAFSSIDFSRAGGHRHLHCPPQRHRPEDRARQPLPQRVASRLLPRRDPAAVHGKPTRQCNYAMISRADGTNAHRAHGGCLVTSATWSPNGKRILVALLNARRLRDEIWALAPFGTFRRLITVGEYASWRPPL